MGILKQGFRWSTPENIGSYYDEQIMQVLNWEGTSLSQARTFEKPRSSDMFDWIEVEAEWDRRLIEILQGS